MQTILITGSNGQLGNEIRTIASEYPDYAFIFTDVAELNICDKNALISFFQNTKIDWVVNCAAYTAVAKAEQDIEAAFAINAAAVKNIGEVAAQFGSKIIHISTDYVFDGKHYLPYTEDMTIHPTSIYGKSKAKGELALINASKEYIIIRTSWLYSSFGNNFVKTMLKLGSEKDTLNVIFDQIGSPTYAADLAQTILQIIKGNTFATGIYHYSNEGACSWYDFAKSIFKLAGITTCSINPIEAKDFYDQTPRPFYSVLNKSKIKTAFGINIPHWEDSLAKCIRLIKKGA